MYICICHAVTDRVIREVVKGGVNSFRELSLKTGCGTQCGSCVREARQLINEVLAEEGWPPSKIELCGVPSG